MLHTSESTEAWEGRILDSITKGWRSEAPSNTIDHHGREVIFLPCWCGECGTWQFMYTDVIFELIEIFPEDDT